MEREVFTGDFVPPKYCFIHTANPTAKDKMMAARYAIYKEAERKAKEKDGRTDSTDPTQARGE
jgi:hypothetical protein